VIGAASVKPEDAASNIAAWLHVAGFEHIPPWLSSPSIDSRMIEGSVAVGAIYAFIIWGIPALRQKTDGKRPNGHVLTQLSPPVPSGFYTRRWVLNFNPSNPKGRKNISFNEDGTVGEGRNANENRWAFVNGHLDLIRQDNRLHNRFKYDPASGTFLCTNDQDAVGLRHQTIYQGRI
jgi:hypothetical protein